MREGFTDYIPYVYFIMNKSTKLKYVGVRYAKGCNPKDLWNSYFTSSSSMKSLVAEYGKEDFRIKILHKYPNDPESAIKKEAEYFSVIKDRKDYINLCYSSGIMDLRINSKAGKIGGNIVYNRKIGIFRNEEERIEWARMGGKVSGKKQAELGLGFHQYKNNPDLHKAWSSMGGKKAGTFQDKAFQSEMGKRGGVKNKGFRWYNDGSKEYKYTKREQENMSFDSFIESNKNLRRGRL